MVVKVATSTLILRSSLEPRPKADFACNRPRHFCIGSSDSSKFLRSKSLPICDFSPAPLCGSRALPPPPCIFLIKKEPQAFRQENAFCGHSPSSSSSSSALIAPLYIAAKARSSIWMGKISAVLRLLAFGWQLVLTFHFIVASDMRAERCAVLHASRFASPHPKLRFPDCVLGATNGIASATRMCTKTDRNSSSAKPLGPQFRKDTVPGLSEILQQAGNN